MVHGSVISMPALQRPRQAAHRCAGAAPFKVTREAVPLVTLGCGSLPQPEKKLNKIGENFGMCGGGGKADMPAGVAPDTDAPNDLPGESI